MMKSNRYYSAGLREKPVNTSSFGMTFRQQYASTPHLFVYQSPPEELTIPDQYIPIKEHIYSSAHEIHRLAEKSAIQHITEKYDSLKRLTDQFADISVCDYNGQCDPKPLRISDHEMLQIESFFKGHKSQVFVCASLANVYFRDSESSYGQTSNWDLRYTGVPLLVLDLGDTKSRDKRRLQLIVAERGTGFLLWRDVIDNLSSYRMTQENFHTFHISNDHRKMAGLSFDDVDAAREFHRHLELITSDFANISLSAPTLKRKNKCKKKVPKFKPPQKTDISQPCCFTHVTSVRADDRTDLYTLQAFVSGR